MIKQNVDRAAYPCKIHDLITPVSNFDVMGIECGRCAFPGLLKAASYPNHGLACEQNVDDWRNHCYERRMFDL